MRSFRRAQARREAKQARRAAILARKGFLVAGSALGASALLAPGAQAASATYTVTTTGDGPSAACTGSAPNFTCTDLRDALAAANADATTTDTNTINFHSGVSGTIALLNAQGSLPINGHANLAINGPGASSLTITNDTTANAHELFKDSQPYTSSVTISGMTLTGGGGSTGSSDPGGAVDFNGGGGTSKYATTGGLTLTNDVITANRTTSVDGGGGVYSQGPLTLTGTTVSGNTATAGAGGGLAVRSGALSIGGNSAIKDNTAAGFGGGLAIESEYSSSSISASTITGNTGSAGGGVFSFNYALPGTLSITDGTYIGNNKAVGPTGSTPPYSGYAYGGGLAEIGGSLKMSGSTVTGNTATGAAGKSSMGGGIMAEPKYPSSITNSTITNNTATQGGGLGVQSALSKYFQTPHAGSLAVRGTTISGNQATGGAGVSLGTLFPGNDVTFMGSTISGNQGGANSFGGGLLINGGLKHQLPPSAPSGLRLHPQTGGMDSDVRLLDSTISGNIATTGGGVSIGDAGHYQLFPTYNGDANTGSIAFDNSTIANNTGSTAAGGIYLGQYSAGSPATQQSGTVAINSTIVSGNTVNGGGSDLVRASGSTTGGFTGAFSLIQAPGSAPLTGPSNITGKDPLLGALANNGGQTQTMLPAAGSPVIDAGKVFGALTTDQLGNPRTVVNAGFPEPTGGDGTDIGAVELPSSKVGPPPPPPAGPTLSATVHGQLIGGGATPLVVGNTSLVNCAVSSGTISSCVIEIRANGTLIASGEVTGTGGSKLSTPVTPTTAGAALLAKNPLGVAATASVVASASASPPSVTGPVELLGGPSITLPTGTRSTKLPAKLLTELKSVASLISGASSATCTAYTSQQPKPKKKHHKGKAHDARNTKSAPSDSKITKAQATAACRALVTDGFKGTTKAVGAGHSKPVASNKTAGGRKKNQRLVISFTGL